MFCKPFFLGSFQELSKKQEEISNEKEEIDRKKRQLIKRKPNEGKAPSKRGQGSKSAAAKNSQNSQDGSGATKNTSGDSGCVTSSSDPTRYQFLSILLLGQLRNTFYANKIIFKQVKHNSPIHNECQTQSA